MISSCSGSGSRDDVGKAIPVISSPGSERRFESAEASLNLYLLGLEGGLEASRESESHIVTSGPDPKKNLPPPEDDEPSCKPVTGM